MDQSETFSSRLLQLASKFQYIHNIECNAWKNQKMNDQASPDDFNKIIRATKILPTWTEWKKEKFLGPYWTERHEWLQNTSDYLKLEENERFCTAILYWYCSCTELQDIFIKGTGNQAISPSNKYEREIFASKFW